MPTTPPPDDTNEKITTKRAGLDLGKELTAQGLHRSELFPEGDFLHGPPLATTPSPLYPCILRPTRYGGTYEGGVWAAFASYEVPADAVGSDLVCARWWNAPTCRVGVGATPDEAYAELVRAVNSGSAG